MWIEAELIEATTQLHRSWLVLRCHLHAYGTHDDLLSATRCRLEQLDACTLHDAWHDAPTTVLMPETDVSRSGGARFDSVGRFELSYIQILEYEYRMTRDSDLIKGCN